MPSGDTQIARAYNRLTIASHSGSAWQLTGVDAVRYRRPPGLASMSLPESQVPPGTGITLPPNAKQVCM